MHYIYKYIYFYHILYNNVFNEIIGRGAGPCDINNETSSFRS